MAAERTGCERETIVLYNQQDKTASCYTWDAPLIRRLDKLIAEGNSDIVLTREGEGWREYEVPKKWVKIRPPARRNLTEEQRQAMADRLRQARDGRAGASTSQTEEGS